jgi:hypothetical protein
MKNALNRIGSIHIFETARPFDLRYVIWRIRYALSGGAIYNSFHCQAFTPASLIKALVKIGFSVKENFFVEGREL